MTNNNKGRYRWYGATPSPSYYRNSIAPHVKSLIVWLAMRSLLPARLAGWMIQHGGMRHA